MVSKKGKIEIHHVIPYEFSGLATLLVDYLSRWGTEMEMLSVLLATLIIGILFDMRGYLNDFWVGITFAVVVVLEFLFTAVVAYKKRELEIELWGAVHELEKSIPATNNRRNNNG